MLCPAEREQARHRPVGRRRAGDQLANLQVDILRRTADARHHLRRISIYVLAQQVDHATWMLPGVVHLGEALLVALVVPGGFIVAATILVVAGEQSILEAKALLHDQAGARVGTHIGVLDRIFRQQIADQAIEEGDVGPRADRRMHVGYRGGARIARVDGDQLRLVLNLRLDHPFEAARVRLGRVAA